MPKKMNPDKTALDATSRPIEELSRSLRTIAASLPVVGSVITEQIFDRMAARNADRASSFLRHLGRRIARIEDKLPGLITDKHIGSDEFFHFFVEILQRAQREVRGRKLDAFQSIILNCMVNDPKHSFDKKDYFWRVLDLLQDEHINVLTYINNQHRSVVMSEIWKAFDATIESDKNFIFAGIDTLANKLIIECTEMPIIPAKTKSKTKKIDHGGQVYRVTDLGLDFLQFIDFKPGNVVSD